MLYLILLGKPRTVAGRHFRCKSRRLAQYRRPPMSSMGTVPPRCSRVSNDGTPSFKFPQRNERTVHSEYLSVPCETWPYSVGLAHMPHFTPSTRRRPRQQDRRLENFLSPRSHVMASLSEVYRRETQRSGASNDDAWEHKLGARADTNVEEGALNIGKSYRVSSRDIEANVETPCISRGTVSPHVRLLGVERRCEGACTPVYCADLCTEAVSNTCLQLPKHPEPRE
ncbi:hypothetical protein QBC46DRAFT_387991 [Diplogelasinospora grovesii]|uniref:Uncharacterized protein n=1 Tax=Diplogelasinospora grovesii TaxID=303347 RepID=A0AAN6N6I7_9PEZI|nr:hypothetical protein QBC46DRAFT_387991 [Diplogelasinospora grovesii]